MKARIKSTGDIMPIAPYARVTLDVCDDRGTPYEVDFEDIELINEDKLGCDADWPSFRREAAKDILCAIVANNNLGYYGDSNTRIVASAIAITDELIKQLREER